MQKNKKVTQNYKKIFILCIYDEKRKKFHNKIGCLQNVYNFKEKKIIIACFFLLLRMELPNRQIEIFERTKVSFKENLFDFWQKKCKNALSTRCIFTSKKALFKKF